MTVWHLELLTAPAAEPIATSDLRRHLNIASTDTSHDTDLANYIKAARTMCEKQISGSRAFVTQQWKYVASKFPNGDEPLLIPLPPLSTASSDVSVGYVDTSGSTQTMASTDIRVTAPRTVRGYVEPAISATWPATYDRRDAVQVTFRAGYGASTDVPETITHAIRLLASHWFSNRESVAEKAMHDVPFTVKSLLESEGYGFYG